MKKRKKVYNVLGGTQLAYDYDIKYYKYLQYSVLIVDNVDKFVGKL